MPVTVSRMIIATFVPFYSYLVVSLGTNNQLHAALRVSDRSGSRSLNLNPPARRIVLPLEAE